MLRRKEEEDQLQDELDALRNNTNLNKMTSKALIKKFHALKIGLGTRHLFIHRKLESFSPFSSLDSKLLSQEVFEGLLVNWTH